MYNHNRFLFPGVWSYDGRHLNYTRLQNSVTNTKADC